MPVYNQVQLYQTAQIFTNMNKLCRTPLVGPPQYPLAACNWLHSRLILLRFRVKNSLLIYNKFQHRTSSICFNVFHLRNKSITITKDACFSFGLDSSHLCVRYRFELYIFLALSLLFWLSSFQSVGSSSVWVRFFSHHYFWGRPGWFWSRR